MSGVSTKISVLDAATPAIEHMYRGVSQLISGMYKLNKATSNAIDMGPFLEAQKSMAEAMAVQKQLAEGCNKVNDEYRQIKENTEQAEAAQRRYNNSLSQGISKATAFGDRLTSSIKRYITMAAGAYGGKQLIDASDTWVNNSARLGLITDSLAKQNVLQQQIYQSAKEARGAYSDTVDVVAKLGLLAGDAFSGNTEIVKFTELMNKSFKLSGASTQEKTAAMYQLTQAMASGRLQGDEFRSIIENAPMLANAIAEYTGVGREGLKELSSDGAISAEIIKNSLFSVADDIESKFSTLPMTFGDAWTNAVSDATMAFSPLYTQMNDMLNSDLVQGVVLEIPNLFEQISLKGQEMLSVIDGVAIVAGPGLNEIANSVGNIASAIFSANGVAGTFIRTIGQIASNSAMVKSIQTLGGSFITVANALNSIMQIATPLLPQVTSIYIAFKMYDTINPVINTVATGVANVANVTINMAGAMSGAKTAQEALNAAMNANPYLGVASAIAKVIAMMVSLIGTIKAVNNAAGLAEESNVDSTIEAAQYARENNVDLSTAQSIINSNQSYNDQANTLYENHKKIVKQRDDAEKQLERLRKAENSSIANSFATNYGFDKRREEMTELQEKINEYNNKIADNYKAVGEISKAQSNMEQFYLDSYAQKQATNKALNGYSDDPNDYMKDFDGNFDVGDVDNVNHINDTVDIASEDLRYMRELAEQEAINQFTNKLLQPQINVTFGEVKETADVDGIVQRITDGLVESLNNSGDIVHI